MQDTIIKVSGMTCQGCVNSVTRVLKSVPGVETVNVSLARGEAALRYDPGKATESELRKAVEEAGFEAA